MMTAIRGAVQAAADTAQAIDAATVELLTAIMSRNDLDAGSITAAWFTTTADLTAAYPAASARRLGWTSVAMLCAREADIAGSLPRCVRVLVICELDCPARHVYIGAAASLRPDLAGDGA